MPPFWAIIRRIIPILQSQNEKCLKGTKSNTSQFVALVALFAALNVVSDSISGVPQMPSHVWYSWNFIMEPITGIVLGPFAGFLATFLGVMIGHSVYFIDVYEFLFTMGAPLGAMFCGLLFRGRWKLALVYYMALIMVYFVSPIAWQLPVWVMWDTYLGGAVLIFIAWMIKRRIWEIQLRNRLSYALALCAFVGLEADVLFRIFVFIPCQTYQLFYGFDVEALRIIWIGGTVETPLKAAMSTFATAIIGPPVIRAIAKMNQLSK